MKRSQDHHHDQQPLDPPHAKPPQQARPRGSRVMPRPHADPYLIAFLVVAFVYALGRMAFAQAEAVVGAGVGAAGAGALACPPVPSGTLFGIPITDLINVGVPACLTVYMVVKGIPDIVAKFAVETSAQRAHDQKTADELRAQINKLEDRLDRALDHVPSRGGGGGTP